jgi:predicted RNase H-like HicB family nuclease
VRYLVLIEKADHNLRAYVPDLPGCVTTGKTREEVLTKIREALSFHLQGIVEDGEPIPQPNSDPECVDVTLPTHA